MKENKKPVLEYQLKLDDGGGDVAREASKQIPFVQLPYGFKFGDAMVQRTSSNKKKGWVIISISSSKDAIEVYVTKKGKMRILNSEGRELE